MPEPTEQKIEDKVKNLESKIKGLETDNENLTKEVVWLRGKVRSIINQLGKSF